MSLFKRLFGKKEHPAPIPGGTMIVATLNDRILPIDRGELYEDPVDEMLQAGGLGEVNGGGTMTSELGEITGCDVDIHIFADEANPVLLQKIIQLLESKGAPKGSRLWIAKTKQEFKIGKREGLALYLDGRNLPAETYQTCDSNYVLAEVKRLTGDESDVLRYWQGPAETAFYVYGESFEAMKRAIQGLVDTYPLCKGARIVQIA